MSDLPIRREVSAERHTFTCEQHRIALEGEPVMTRLYGKDGNANFLTNPAATPNGQWVIDTSTMWCPTTNEQDDGDVDCDPDKWRIFAVVP